jgi:hypothetical protein
LNSLLERDEKRLPPATGQAGARGALPARSRPRSEAPMLAGQPPAPLAGLRRRWCGRSSSRGGLPAFNLVGLPDTGGQESRSACAQRCRMHSSSFRRRSRSIWRPPILPKESGASTPIPQSASSPRWARFL